MTGILLWEEKIAGARQRAVTLEEMRVLQKPFLCARVLREERLPEALLRRRMLAAAKKLGRAGVKELILPADGSGEGLVQRLGMEPVSTAALRQMIAADWVTLELGQRQISAPAARVAVAAPRLTGEVVRTVTELALRHRYVLLDVPRDWEELSRRLRRQYGISLLDGRELRQRDEAQALVLFAPEMRESTHPVVLRLWDTAEPLPPILLPPILEEALPRGADRGQLLSALLRCGVLRPGQICLGSAAT